MPGKIQHEIPRLYQRGFLIPDTGHAERIFVYRRGGNSFSSNIDKSGAESYFYSKLNGDEQKTLDDKITEYETRLGSIVRQLREVPLGATVDASVAAEVVAHLTTRNAHLRGTFVEGFQTIAAKNLQIFSDEENIYRLLGTGSPSISAFFREHLGQALSREPHFASSGIPMAVLEQIAFALMRENSQSFIEQLKPMIQTFLNHAANEVPVRVREEHNKVLTESVIPEVQVEKLGAFSWRVISSKTDLILPDCVALAVNKDGQIHSLILVGLNDIELVLLPLTSRTLLLGSRTVGANFDPAYFNAAAASCSHRYFLSASQSPNLSTLINLIGTRNDILVETAIKEGLRNYLPEQETNEQAVLPQSDTEPIARSPLNIPITFRGAFDQDAILKITKALSDLLAEAAWTIPFDRLDGITFADDYPGALLAIDRGLSGVSPLKTQQDNMRIGVAQCPTVVRNGIIKSHIIIYGGIGRMLLSEDNDSRILAVSIVATQLAHAGVTQVFDETLPDILLAHVGCDLAADLQRCTYPAWNGYLASRASADFNAARLGNSQSLLMMAIKDAYVEIPKARLAYRRHGNLRILIDSVYLKITFILEYAANLLGHADGSEREPLEGTEDLKSELQNRELMGWLSVYRHDLACLWDRRGQWKSVEEFLMLNRHAERLLYPFYIFPWTTPDGLYRVEVPIYADREALLAECSNE